MAEKRFLDFLDRIDGGGMGQSGDTFEGGGLLSMLGNLFASPYGSEDPERRARRDAFYAGQMGEPMAAPKTSRAVQGMSLPMSQVPPRMRQDLSLPASVNGGGDGLGPMPTRSASAPNLGFDPAYLFAQAMSQSIGIPLQDALKEVASGQFDNSIQTFVNNNYQLPQGY